ncbi:MAG: 5-(carboxyamino)imidazole ribonucleotide synthase [Oligoflexus sp.]
MSIVRTQNEGEQATQRSPVGPVGILGGGQLAMMLAGAGQRLGLAVHIFATSPGDVAIANADDYVVSDFNQREDLHSFFSKVKTVIYENEWIDPKLLEQAIKSTSATISPLPQAMAACANKLGQKELLQDLKVPSSRFVALKPNSGEEPIVWLQGLQQLFPQGCVLKWAKGGYDGKGTMVFPVQSQTQVIASEIVNFVTQAIAKNVSVYAEEFVDFQQELALLTIRAQDGSCKFYPMVVTMQEEGVCVEVTGPAQAFGLSPALEQEAQEYAKKIGAHLELRGVFAIEFFQTKNGHVLVNEIAPRVHNSGHFTLDGAAISQFESHWRAVLGLPIADLSCAKFFAMVNILGPKQFVGELQAPDLAGKPYVLHWYRKKESRPGRKLGHINISAESEAKLHQQLSEVHQQLSLWSSKWQAQA